MLAARSTSAQRLEQIWSERKNTFDLPSDSAALAYVAWAKAMPWLARATDSEEWWEFFDVLVAASRDATNEPTGSLWSQQLLTVELPLTFAGFAVKLPSFAGMLEPVWTTLQQSLLKCTDDDGMFRDVPLEYWLPIFASWTRSLALGKEADRKLSKDAESRFQDVVESLLRLANRDGSILFRCDAHGVETHHIDLWRTAETFVDARLRKVITAIWGAAAKRGRSNTARAKRTALPTPSANSERAGIAILRPSWSAPHLIIDYRGSPFRLELEGKGGAYLSGACDLHLSLDGQQLSPQSSWEELCWISDDDVDYLELQQSFAEGVTIQRHLLFARDDAFVFFADAVLGEKAAAIEYRLTLPLAKDVSIESAADTRELGLVKGGRRRAVVLPLALSEWRGDRRQGELAEDANRLQLRQFAGAAQNLFAPWFIDLAPNRLRRPATWRQLTVAEDRQIQPHDAAVGYRVQVGNKHWLFYRSLIACGNRTVLGHNLVSEFLAARFGKSGVPETLIEIEAPADDDD
ncbi:MAG TPA: hypothetical protein VHC22_13835 [Pirellulales bacterium]|nr:hypothetical protein [Pirellulales bacterium]